MSNSPQSHNPRSVAIASILSPIISAVLALAGVPKIFISLFLFAVLSVLGWLLVKEGYKLIALLYFAICLVVASNAAYSVYRDVIQETIKEASTEYQKKFDEGMIPYEEGRRDSDPQKFRAALQKFQEAVSVKPDFTTGVKYVGRCCLRLGRFEEAYDAFQKVAKVAPAEVKDDLISLYIEWATDSCRKGNGHKALTITSFLQRLDMAAYNKLINAVGSC